MCFLQFISNCGVCEGTPFREDKQFGNFVDHDKVSKPIILWYVAPEVPGGQYKPCNFYEFNNAIRYELL